MADAPENNLSASYIQSADTAKKDAEKRAENVASAEIARKITLTAEKTVWELAQTPVITVQAENNGSKEVTLSASDFVFVQGELRCKVPENAEAARVTVQPGERCEIALPAGEAVGAARGEFRLLLEPDGAELVLTLS